MSNVGDFVKDATFGLLDFGGKKKKKKQDGVPTIDMAAQNRQEQDRLRRRRGNLSNIFGGSSLAAPMTASKALLGE